MKSRLVIGSTILNLALALGVAACDEKPSADTADAATAKAATSIVAPPPSASAVVATASAPPPSAPAVADAGSGDAGKIVDAGTKAPAKK